LRKLILVTALAIGTFTTQSFAQSVEELLKRDNSYWSWAVNSVLKEISQKVEKEESFPIP
jgi:hypothetical protein